MKKLFVFVLMLVVTYQMGVFARKILSTWQLTSELSSREHVQELLADESASDSVVYNNDELYVDFSEEFPYLAQVESETNVLGDASDKWIEVNLTQQRLYGWEGSTPVFNYLVSTGKWAPTPTGNFAVWIKLAKTRMRGGSKALGTFYDLPNVPCTMYFYKGYGIHGAYWHNNFGHPMSHGCVNMRPNESCQVFNWASVGTKVNIHY